MMDRANSLRHADDLVGGPGGLLSGLHMRRGHARARMGRHDMPLRRSGEPPRRSPNSLRYLRWWAAPTLCALAASTCAPGTGFQFSAPFTLTAQGGSRPTVAVNPRDGTIYVAWVGTDGGTSDVYLARLDPGAPHPTSPVRVNHLPGDAAPHDQAPARVAVGPDGAVYLAWQNNRHVPGRRFPASDLRFARSTDRGATFEPATYINHDAGGAPASHAFHDLAVARDGTILVSWIQSGEASGSAGGHGEQPATEGTGSDPVRGTGSDPGRGSATDTAHGSGSEVHISASRDGGLTFTPSRVVDRGACPCCRTAIALAPDGSTFLAWRKIFEDDIRDIVVARVMTPELEPPELKAAQSAVHPAVRPHRDDWRLDACPHAGPALLADESGTVHLAWYTGRDGGAGLYYTASDDQVTTFAPPRSILTGGAIPPSQISLAATVTGGIILAWEDRRDPARRIHVAILEQGPSPRAGHSDLTAARAADIRDRILTLSGATPALAHAAGTTALAWLDGEAVRLMVAR